MKNKDNETQQFIKVWSDTVSTCRQRSPLSLLKIEFTSVRLVLKTLTSNKVKIFLLGIIRKIQRELKRKQFSSDGSYIKFHLKCICKNADIRNLIMEQMVWRQGTLWRWHENDWSLGIKGAGAQLQLGHVTPPTSPARSVSEPYKRTKGALLPPGLAASCLTSQPLIWAQDDKAPPTISQEELPSQPWASVLNT